MSPRRRPRRLTTLFVLLSTADLALTWLLLSRTGGKVYEANWFAGSVLSQFGLPGLAVFKALIVVLTVALFGVIAVSRPRVARGLATFACGAVGAVVLYSFVLWRSLEFPPAAYSRDRSARSGQLGAAMDPRSQRRMEFMALLAEVRGALAAECCTLREAVGFLAAADAGKDPDLLARRRARIGASSDDEYLAAMAARGALSLLAEDASVAARQRAQTLLADYEAGYGASLLPFLLAEPQVFEPWGGGHGQPSQAPPKTHPDGPRSPPERS